jgi:heat shock protein HspQ
MHTREAERDWTQAMTEQRFKRGDRVIHNVFEYEGIVLSVDGEKIYVHWPEQRLPSWEDSSDWVLSGS